MTEKRYVISGDRSISDHQKKRLYDLNDFDGMISVTECLNELHEENKKLKRENESLNSQLIRLDKELFCQDCLTCRHSKSINITVRCANGNGITDYQMNCDFYEIDEEWME